MKDDQTVGSWAQIASGLSLSFKRDHIGRLFGQYDLALIPFLVQDPRKAIVKQ
uniref:AlNc14C14G1614 protein n=1 Tax=Albugo laibachii Nc14 TaxID=890382 RepID=F0W3U8_9STRA|nr:AlNc14C14G1614 [Albugo laibachii Nc14]|eukprot:CCA15697.1 AlNc14C14G1614 [Albugo laibachii Nc14]